jgi:hypothetical protein
MTIRQSLERYVVERPVSDGHFEKVSLWSMVEGTQAEAVADERARIAAGVLALPAERWFMPDSYDVDRDAVLAIVNDE